MTENNEQEKAIKSKLTRNILIDLLFVLVLLAGASLRLTGVNWDEGQHLHPDERFLTGVETGIRPAASWDEYWDTERSPLNPHNVGYGFFVYGTFPIFLTRYAAEWFGQTGYNEITLVGRQISALADLGTVLMVYLIASRLFDRRAGLLAGAFSAFTVLEIQLSHYFATDTFLNLFTYAAIYFAVRIATEKDEEQPFKWWDFALFGAMLGLAVASKVTTVLVAFTLPLAVAVRLMRVDKDQRFDLIWQVTGYMVGGAFASLLVFRIFQPYAFSGPGFFGLRPNEKWVENLSSLQAQAAGDVDWPPSIQWARLPVWFSAQNMAQWGMGIPFAIAAWAGFLWAGWRIFVHKRWHILVVWSWVAFYFTWQSSVFNPTMRYQLPSYPGLAVFAGWGLTALWDLGGSLDLKARLKAWVRPMAVVTGVLTLGLTALWALAFTQIYKVPVTRVAATEWIYQNVPGPLTLPIEGAEGTYNQPLPFPYNVSIQPERLHFTSFTAHAGGTLSEVRVHEALIPGEGRTLTLQLASAGEPDFPLSTALVDVSFEAQEDSLRSASLSLQTPPPLTAGEPYLLRIGLSPGRGAVTLVRVEIEATKPDGQIILPVMFNAGPLTQDGLFDIPFTLADDGVVNQVRVDVVNTPVVPLHEQTLMFVLGDTPELDPPLAVSELTINLEEGPASDLRFEFDVPVELVEGQVYYVQIHNLTDGGGISLQGSAITVESPWDDGLPLRTLYDGYGGIYQPSINFDMYVTENQDKLDRFLFLLDEADYVTISSSRQWASTPRIPERFPLNVTYYRNLLGCPEDKTIQWCYETADVGMFEGRLGFELVAVFQSDPNLWGVRINDQPSEEAFTVYDHPKVFIFQKTADYNAEEVTDILGAVDFSQVVHLTPKKAAGYEPETRSLMLPEDRFAVQQESGTWSDLFNEDSLINRSESAALLAWYLAVMLLGLGAYPLLRKLLPGLADRGYPLARTAGLLLLAYLSWLGGSTVLSFSRGWIAVFYLLILAVGAGLAYAQREELREELKANWHYFALVEFIFLALFVFSLTVRLGNPDLWHPFKGGEKPMDFSYFNAVLKSAKFPPYDPWFAGGYINYYYYGFVYVGTLVKLLGIVPATAYNLIIPTLFAMLGMGAFSVGWNLLSAVQEKTEPGVGIQQVSPWWVGTAAALGTAFLGNLGSLRMILRGYRVLGGGAEFAEDAFFLTEWRWAWKGFLQIMQGEGMPYGIGDWYWIPSRVIPAPNDVEPITEFPWFTFVYADLHAHMMALTMAVLVIAWALSLVLGGLWVRKASLWTHAGSLVFGALAIGALRPTNTWDLPTYLALGMLAAVYGAFRHWEPPESILDEYLGKNTQKIILGGLLAGLLAWLSFLLYKPYGDWYVQGYSQIIEWTGTQTPSKAFLTHWGLFLFVLVGWMAWETRQWMAQTPVSELRKLEKALAAIVMAAVGLLVLMLVLHFRYEVRVSWMIVPLGVWAAVLMFRPGMPEAKRAVLFMVGTALFLTLMVEVIVLSGDIGRMNTVFKFYLQAWVLLAVSSAAAGGWVWIELRQWTWRWRAVWQMGLAFLVTGAALFPFLGTAAKIKDRMAIEAPNSLDGMAFMPYSTFHDQGEVFDLSQDHEAIRWMQQNVEGTPVIVEGHNPEYRWGTRYTIYTGLPGVLGWRWHQTQQRIGGPAGVVDQRADEIWLFYVTPEQEEAAEFLETYDVEYIIVGQLEQAYYGDTNGLAKFEELDGILWREVYRYEDTVIYQVIE